MIFIGQYDKIPSSDYGERFVGMNSGLGFQCVFSDIVDERKLKRLYAIKAAAGCGKSTFMKNLASKANELGIKCERYACSSDHTSLDCIILNDSVAVLDGTAPHLYETVYNGAASEIIDFSRFWDNNILINERPSIIMLNDEKKSLYSRAYDGLRVMRLLMLESFDCLREVIDLSKARSALERFLDAFKWREQTDGFRYRGIYRSVGMKGKKRLDTLEKNAELSVYVSDVYGSAYVFMGILSDLLSERNVRHEISVDPITPELICDVYVPAIDLLVTVEPIEAECFKVFNMERFINKAALSGIKGSLKLANKCSSLIFQDVREYMTKASSAHFALEKIYSTAMDFDSLSDHLDSKLSEIVSLAQ